MGVGQPVGAGQQELTVYRERAYLVSYLSARYESYLCPAPDAEPGFSMIVYIQSPEGQLSWHIADSDLDLFQHLDVDPRIQWDGHTTPEKYERLRALTF